MAISYIAWITFTITGYTLLGGEGGMMDGGLFVLMLCFSALISSFVYLVIWMSTTAKDEPKPEDEILIEPWS